jgi:hypothetical protein
MSVWDRIRDLMGRAKEGATDMAQLANLKLDIRGLEGRRDHVFREIGRKVWALQGEGRRFTEFEGECEEISQLEARLRDKQKELEAVRERPPSSGAKREPASPN